ncbi:hypothetical protein LRR81_04105 [Metabacillus sp. GX 13764]|uniref:YpoC family protein n=1 Tax=Metabacillus kandeliae TaxID=2900151 RepID=UPI001E5C7CC6|nr:hypothetical protein [Metabacillus kandeliae]MCD7033403.1 hypothetical protein [Metabacillus kandeliae]
MENHKDLLLPERFRFRPFFQEKQHYIVAINYSEPEETISHQPFWYDLLFFHGQTDADRPWTESREYFLRLLLNLKENTSERIANSIKEGSKADEKDFIMLAALFILFLNWGNHQPVTSLHPSCEWLNELKIKPVNARERLQFLLERPGRYHSIIQLQELFAELEKKIYKEEAAKKRTPN